MEINTILAILIFFLSIFQSIFGIGLLALGTPILLIIGFSFIEALFFLLPCSIIVSSLTFFLIDRKHFDKNVVNFFLFYSLPGIIIGLIIILFYELHINFKILIGTIIIVSIFLKRIINKEINFSIKVKKIINFTIGFIHGISNMGGSFLSIYLMTLYKEKIKIRYHLTFAYIFFAITQLIFLSITYSELINFYSIRFFLVLSVIGAILGNFCEKFFNNNFYIKILNSCILITAIILIFNSFKEIL